MITNSYNETVEVGYTLGKVLESGDIVCLTGDIGAGKTVLTKGIAKSLGVEEMITSPTFTIVNEYLGDTNLYHFDVYRLQNGEDFIEVGFEHYLTKDGVIVIEWSEIVEDVLPDDKIVISIERAEEENMRSIRIDFGNKDDKEKQFKGKIEEG